MDEPLLQVPLHTLHRSLGARMVPFAGYEMPLNYAPGLIAEHNHTRTRAGLFDASHMGQIVLRSRQGGAAAAAALERLVPGDMLGLKVGKQRYTLLTNGDGGIIDDLMVANLGDRLLLIVNASRKSEDAAHLRRHLGAEIAIETLPDRALVALQGPEAVRVAVALAPILAALRFMDVAEVTLAGTDCVVSRSGYTGEDGFEISVDAADAETLARALLADDAVLPVGLGARDSLRLEAGLPLYGNDLGPETSPVEASLGWTIARCRRRGGAREGGFPGAARILGELAAGPRRRRVGLRVEGRVPVRAHARLLAGDAEAGEVTSGSFGPTVNAPIAVAYVAAAHAAPGTRLAAEVRGNRLDATVATLPFVPTRYVRG